MNGPSDNTTDWLEAARAAAFSRDYQTKLRQEIRGLAAQVPPLQMDDAFGIVSERARIDLLCRFGPRHARLKQDELAACHGIALDATFACETFAAMLAGIVAWDVRSADECGSQMGSWKVEWSRKLKLARKRVSDGTASDCDRVLCDRAMTSLDAVVSREAIVKSMRQARRKFAAGRHECPMAVELEQQSMLADVGILTEEQAFTKAIRIDERGALYLDPLSLRDLLGSRSPVTPTKSTEDLDQDLGRQDQGFPSADMLSIQREEREAMESALGSLDSILAVESARHEPGSPAWHVLANGRALFSGQLSARELSKATGIPRRTLDGAIVAVKQSILHHPTMRSIARDWPATG